MKLYGNFNFNLDEIKKLPMIRSFSSYMYDYTLNP